MSDQTSYEPMLEMYIFETTQLIGQLEQAILDCEKTECYSQKAIEDIFRVMHTIKGSSAMMAFDTISILAHTIEDLFDFLRREEPEDLDCCALSDLVFKSIDFIKVEIEKLKNNDEPDGDATVLIQDIKTFLYDIKNNGDDDKTPKRHCGQIHTKEHKHHIEQKQTNPSESRKSYKATIYFQDGCQMENIRAFSIIHKLKDIAKDFHYFPKDIIDNDESADFIRKNGFEILFKTDSPYEQIHEFFMQTIFLKDLELIELKDNEKTKTAQTHKNPIETESKEKPKRDNHRISTQQSIISVNVDKLDRLMDLVGEMVIAEAMVTHNPDLKDLELDNFEKAARQLHKITGEIQDMVMSIRMVPVAMIFQKMHRLVRDMCRQLNKNVKLQLIGENTEVDKNIIEHISDPLMHLIRNSIDHGIEDPQHRKSIGKSETGTIILEAKNAGKDVLIIVKDDGKGLNKTEILKRARQNKLLTKPEDEMNDKEIFDLILQSGFSIKDDVSQYSGRGVGMDVVARNIEAIGGLVSIDSTENMGTTITLKIPLTLAIIDGMNLKVGNSCYTIPTTSIKESFRPEKDQIIVDPNGNEMVMIRGECYEILRLHKHFKVYTDITEFTDGILIMVEVEEKAYCIFADELLGQQQIVVKPLPSYIKKTREIRGLSGCTLLGDGSISLILDAGGLSTEQV